ncbi:MAG: 2,3-cyclic 3-phosphodiesterase [Sphingomonadales bacterium]|jgi:2'-5' RNA ligase|nr:2,3-cyclic 3-phosphodiesterase [Sphingomonadales bacterium]MEA3043239.1 2,3-cyclic 3-phosphodiesterase [Sphingomonadales bacterium]MEA3047918.1 2,3-cyclic 3-phosphodiesterase [Sphingomonadales bacterium]
MPCQPLHRLFYALRPPPAAASHLHDRCAWLRPAHRRVGPDRLHITLNILDDRPCLPLDLLAAMVAVGDAVAANPFRIIFDQLSGGRRSIVLRPSEKIAALHRFQRHLAEGLAHAGVETRRDARFSPHITLLHRGCSGFTEAVDPVSWRVEEFFLIESLVGWTRHVVRGRWPLDRRAS